MSLLVYLVMDLNDKKKVILLKFSQYIYFLDTKHKLLRDYMDRRFNMHEDLQQIQRYKSLTVEIQAFCRRYQGQTIIFKLAGRLKFRRQASNGNSFPLRAATI